MSEQAASILERMKFLEAKERLKNAADAYLKKHISQSAFEEAQEDCNRAEERYNRGLALPLEDQIGS